MNNMFMPMCNNLVEQVVKCTTDKQIKPSSWQSRSNKGQSIHTESSKGAKHATNIRHSKNGGALRQGSTVDNLTGNEGKWAGLYYAGMGNRCGSLLIW